ncbi:uncharacterized protein LOC124145567 [Haliotis rufescens]|uniref:uncharacterized protein LOC124145567 n=1 Tax=Haliotis rufescens TaxID=6454 RepID=UPI00201EAE1E|nr:uncharacterized protein LOC124145567 [Haliotis rufescens]
MSPAAVLFAILALSGMTADGQDRHHVPCWRQTQCDSCQRTNSLNGVTVCCQQCADAPVYPLGANNCTCLMVPVLTPVSTPVPTPRSGACMHLVSVSLLGLHTVVWGLFGQTL